MKFYTLVVVSCLFVGIALAQDNLEFDVPQQENVYAENPLEVVDPSAQIARNKREVFVTPLGLLGLGAAGYLIHKLAFNRGFNNGKHHIYHHGGYHGGHGHYGGHYGGHSHGHHAPYYYSSW